MKNKPQILWIAVCFLAKISPLLAQADCAALAKAADTQIAEKNLRLAITTCNTALNSCKTADWYARRGAILLQINEPQKAVADLTTAINLQPTAIAYAQRGLAYAKQGDADASRNDFNKALDLDAKNKEILRLRDEAETAVAEGIAAKKAEEKTAAKPNMPEKNNAETADIADAPVTDEPNLARRKADATTGSLRSRLPQNDAANYNAGNNSNPNNKNAPQSSFRSGVCYEAFLLAHNGNFAAARRAANDILRRQPNNNEAYRVLGYAAAQQNDRSAAIRYYSTALQLDRNDAVAYTQRGLQYGILGDNAQSLRDYNTALQIDPRSKDALYLRGIYNVTSNNRRRQQQGCTDLAQAAALGMPKAQAMLQQYCK